MSMEKRLTYQLILGGVVTVAGLVLLFIGCFIQPKGEIHSSVLVAFGEACTFAGALIGVDYHYKYARYKEERRSENKGMD